MVADYRHFFDGGTMVTNFKLDKFEQYQKAIELYKLEDPTYVLHVEKRAFSMKGTYYLSGYGSLHQFKGGDLTRFWEIFKSLEK